MTLEITHLGGWLIVGGIWAVLTYSGLLARVQRMNPRGADANFEVDVICSLMVALAVFFFFPLGIFICWRTRGFGHGHQFWRKRRR